MIGRYVVAARRVDVESASRRLELADENRREIERVVLHELLERERLRRLEKRAITGDGFANTGVRQFCCHFIQLRGREKEQCLRQDDVDEIERVGNAIRDVLDAPILSITVGNRFDERLVIMNV